MAIMSDDMMQVHHEQAAQAAPLEVKNTIELVGTIVLQRDRTNDKGVVAVPRTNLQNARMKRLLVQVEEGDGAIYAIPIDVSYSTHKRQALVDELQGGDRVRVRGRLRTEQTFDRRFASDDHPDGRPTRTVNVVVEEIEPAEPDDIDGSWLQLTGRISVVADIRRHEVTIDEEVGRTFLVVQWVEASRRRNSMYQHVRIDRIPLDIPLLIDSSVNGLRAGNVVTVEGRLEPFRRQLRPQTNKFIERFLIDTQQKQQVEYATLNPAARAERERKDRQQLGRLHYEKSVRVRAGYVELHEGSPMSVDAARVARAAFVKHQKEQRVRATQPPAS
jgi:hypothetical protein